MARVDKEITFSAPLEKVFNYVNDSGNLPEFWPSLVEIKELQLLPNGGYSSRWVYKMAGIRFEGTSECVDIVPNQYIVAETKGGVNSTITWTFRSMEDVTRVTFTVEYKIPIPLLGRLAETVIQMMNEQEGDLIMANLKARFMSPVAETASVR